METTLIVWYTCLTVSIIIIIHLLIYKLVFMQRKYVHLPPSPGLALPIIGHLHLLKQPLHRCLYHLSQKCGPIFSLKLGARHVVVVSSSNLVEECFTKSNNTILANRPKFQVDKYIAYNHTTMNGANYGEHWRSLRRIAAQEVLSTSRLNGLLHIRKDEIRRLLLSLHKINYTSTSEGYFTKVELRPKLSELTLNVMMRMIAGKRCSREDGDGEGLLKLVRESFEIAAASNPQDFLPFLRWIDYGGFKKRMTCVADKMDEFLQSLVEEHRREKRNTMIGHLLSLQQSQPELYSDLTIKGLVLSMLFAGTDTSSVTIEWAMSLLLNHPHILTKATEELETQVGLHRLIDEEDLSNLPYLQNIIKETLRLFPPLPLLIPHEASEDCKIGGYDVQSETILLVNAWAVHRDPHVWDKATDFVPERFEGKEVAEVVHKLLPFGMGRRACPGVGLAQRILGVALGSLIQCFEWERVSSDDEKIDLEEGIGLSMPKLKPLEAMVRPREIMNKINACMNSN